jgi:hypothetical protein
MTEAELRELVVLLHAKTPAERLSAMEIRTIIEFLDGRGYSISKPKEH